MALLILQHVECEGPGYIEDFAASRDLKIEVVRVFDGAPVPDPRGFEAMIVMGGPMNAYEEDRYPWLIAENAAIQAAVLADVPYLGICLGSQLLAKALGAAVTRNPVEEIGFADIRLTSEGRQDVLFRGFPAVMPVLHWHEDMWDVAPGATLLASSAACAHQAFRRGRAYGIQFHVETGPEIISAWIKEYEGQLRVCGLWDGAAAMVTEAAAQAETLREQTLKLMTNFWDLVVRRQSTLARRP